MTTLFQMMLIAHDALLEERADDYSSIIKESELDDEPLAGFQDEGREGNVYYCRRCRLAHSVNADRPCAPDNWRETYGELWGPRERRRHFASANYGAALAPGDLRRRRQ